MELFANIFGYAAAICMVFGYLPQAIHTIRTRDTAGLAMPTFLLMGFGSLFFVIQGILLRNLPLVITNVITAVCCVIITGIKLANDAKARKNKS